MSEGARVTELLTALNWLRLIRVGSETKFAPRFPVELGMRGNEEQFDRFLTRVSALCGYDRVGLDEYGPPARIDAYDEDLDAGRSAGTCRPFVASHDAESGEADATLDGV